MEGDTQRENSCQFIFSAYALRTFSAMASSIEKIFFSRGRQIGSVFLLPPDVAIELTRHFISNGIDVYGTEGFLIFGDRIQPQQEHSCDFDESVSRRHELVIDFLTQRLGTDLWFEIITNEML